MRKLVGVAVAVALVLTVSGTALAARGGNGGGGGGGHGGGGGNVVAPPAASIVMNEVGPFAFGGYVTFTTNAAGLNGGEYPLVYVRCDSVVDGSVLYGQLDYPTTAFLLGGGSSPWWLNRVDANCNASLWSYGGSKGEYMLAGPVPFFASGN
ncbi:MAG: hypothetical protein MUE82_12035 [Chloroflexi bacterium]|nr:hypothetical protein [Chloroflexota bacterium]